MSLHVAIAHSRVLQLLCNGTFQNEIQHGILIGFWHCTPMKWIPPENQKRLSDRSVAAKCRSVTHWDIHIAWPSAATGNFLLPSFIYIYPYIYIYRQRDREREREREKERERERREEKRREEKRREEKRREEKRREEKRREEKRREEREEREPYGCIWGDVETPLILKDIARTPKSVSTPHPAAPSMPSRGRPYLFHPHSSPRCLRNPKNKNWKKKYCQNYILAETESSSHISVKLTTCIIKMSKCTKILYHLRKGNTYWNITGAASIVHQMHWHVTTMLAST